MKLRLRNHETRETLRLEFPDTCTFHELHQRICVASSSSSVHFSLNRKDELYAQSPFDTLASLDVTSGDLIYYSLDPSAFRLPSQTLNQDVNRQASDPQSAVEDTISESSQQDWTMESAIKDSKSVELGTSQKIPNPDVNDENKENSNESSCVDEKTKESAADTEAMDVEYDVEMGISKSLSEPYFLKKVLMDEVAGTSELMLLVMATHAVMLESGFVLFDQVSGSQADSLGVSSNQHLISLCYTLPELITSNGSITTESVGLKFQSLGHVVNVNGSLGKGSSLYRVYLDRQRFVPALYMVMENLKSDKDGSSSKYHEVFEFWKMAKDGLVLPLLIDLCDKSGLSLPPCLMRLPTELKLKIMESLSGVAVGRSACVCLEMRYLASNNDLWKQKCVEEFGFEVMNANDSVNWKERYVFHRQMMKDSNRRIRREPFPLGLPPRRQDPYRFGVPFPAAPYPFIWGDNDLNPGGIPSPFGGRRLGFRQVNLRRNFSPSCNLGGFNG